MVRLQQRYGWHYLWRAINDAHPSPSPERRRLLKLFHQIVWDFAYVRPQFELRAHCVQNVNSHIPGKKLAHQPDTKLPRQGFSAPFRMLVNHGVQMG